MDSFEKGKVFVESMFGELEHAAFGTSLRPKIDEFVAQKERESKRKAAERDKRRSMSPMSKKEVYANCSVGDVALLKFGNESEPYRVRVERVDSNGDMWLKTTNGKYSFVIRKNGDCARFGSGR